jgi:ABC-type branched-subunit amino acid transport system substrate-binding protein
MVGEVEMDCTVAVDYINHYFGINGNFVSY